MNKSKKLNIKVSLEALTVLDAIDHHGSFSAAAEILHRVPSTLTYTVQKLEQQLGIVIFDRTGHRSQLTASGKLLLREGRYLLDAAHRLEQRVCQQADGWENELRITLGGITPIEPLIPLIAEFDQLKSGTTLIFKREIFKGIWDALVNDRADLVVGAYVRHAPEECFLREIGSVEMVLVAAPHHPLAQEKTPLSNEQIRQHRAIAVADTSRSSTAYSAAGVLTGQDVLFVHSNSAKMKLIQANLGIGFLPRSYVQEHLDDGQLIELATQQAPLRSPSCFAWRNPKPGKALQWFINRLEQAVAENHLKR
ncbi:LysR family transcriptional regulator [Solimicrobium silvestre]|uniref:Transcriptional regulator n=1 Tax=Solimicrobium silvestre TaxID=2099400 RepID=A0A2S9GU73_9BURK|nr:LysR family transcriptional regulator [Solimicrobium silvestre]PRC91260.1 Transcriptional regulator [Solimicrobium silvestre]